MLASAQEAAPAPAEAAPAPAAEPAPAAGSVDASASVGVGASADGAAATAETSPPAPTPAPAAEEPKTETPAATTDTDHEGVIGRLGVGLLGQTSVTLVQPYGFNEQQLSLPLIGARYWFDERLALQVGVGLNHSSGDNNVSTATRGFDTATLWGMAVHVGAPFVFFYDKHYKFLVQPELNAVFGTGRIHDNLTAANDQSVQMGAWGLDAGARLGAEIHFGFIGIPKLSLQGSVGAYYMLRQAAVSDWENGRVVERAITRHSLGTAHNADPWDLFTSSIAALYYF